MKNIHNSFQFLIAQVKSFLESECRWSLNNTVWTVQVTYTQIFSIINTIGLQCGWLNPRMGTMYMEDNYKLYIDFPLRWRLEPLSPNITQGSTVVYVWSSSGSLFSSFSTGWCNLHISVNTVNFRWRCIFISYKLRIMMKQNHNLPGKFFDSAGYIIYVRLNLGTSTL